MQVITAGLGDRIVHLSEEAIYFTDVAREAGSLKAPSGSAHRSFAALSYLGFAHGVRFIISGPRLSV